MATINLNLSQKVDIICREKDDFNLIIGATDENGNALSGDFYNDDVVLFVVRNSKNEPVKILSTNLKAHSDMTDLVYGFNAFNPTQDVINDYEKRAVAIQKTIGSREINATAFSDLYHPKLTQQFNSTIGGADALFNTRTSEKTDKIWFTLNPAFSYFGIGSSETIVTHIPCITYNEVEKQFQIICDSVTFDLPLGKYKYDIKQLSGLYCPTNVNTNEPIIDKSIFESVTTLIYGSLDVKKD